MESKEELWKRKRFTTYISFLISNLLLGMEYSLTFVTLWLYLTEVVHTEEPELYYNLISSAYLVSGIAISLTFGRAVDKSRNVKAVTFFANMAVILGNLVYAMPFSPWFLFFGRLLAGCGIILRPLTYGETAKCYNKNDIQRQFLGIGIMAGLGELFGPTFNMFFRYIQISVGSLKINYLNIPGIYMAMFFSISQLANFFILHNLSEEYETYNIKVDIKSHEVMITEEKDENAVSVLKLLFFNSDTRLLIFTSFFIWGVAMLYDLWVPILVVETIHWSYMSLSVIFTGKATLSAIVFVFFIIFYISDDKLYFIASISLFSVVLSMAIVMILRFVKDIITIHRIVLWVMYCCFFALVVFMEFTYLPNVFAKLIVARHQTFAEGTRSSTSLLGALLARLVSSYLYLTIQYTGPTVIMVAVFTLIMFVKRRNTLQFPSVDHWIKTNELTG